MISGRLPVRYPILRPAPLLDVPAVARDVLVGLDADQPLLLQVAFDGSTLRSEGHFVEKDLLDLGIGFLAVRLLGLSDPELEQLVELGVLVLDVIRPRPILDWDLLRVAPRR